MAYLGNNVPANFQTPPAVVRFNGNGSTTTFALGRTIGSVQEILVSVDGVVQDTSAYTVPDGSTLTFTAAPSSGTNNIFVYFLDLSAGSVTPAAENKGNFKTGGMFRTNSQNLTIDTTILATENAQVTGTITVDSGVTLTVNSGGRLVIS
tara:strand:+ start:2215 stop:2664 length:450 start_codon:yes stop_codon:yes gene_type:complete